MLLFVDDRLDTVSTRRSVEGLIPATALDIACTVAVDSSQRSRGDEGYGVWASSNDSAWKVNEKVPLKTQCTRKSLRPGTIGPSGFSRTIFLVHLLHHDMPITSIAAKYQRPVRQLPPEIAGKFCKGVECDSIHEHRAILKYSKGTKSALYRNLQ
jgi:hypothetical protein